MAMRLRMLPRAIRLLRGMDQRVALVCVRLHMFVLRHRLSGGMVAASRIRARILWVIIHEAGHNQVARQSYNVHIVEA